MKEVLISIQPKWVEKIVNGEKTIEVRKSRPKSQTPFKVYIYETKGKQIEKLDGCYITYYGRGKVIGEFVCDEITEFGNNFFLPSMLWIEKEACLSGEEICKYLGEKESGFAWHISDLKIYGKPKELSEFRKPCPYTDGTYCLERKCEHYDDYSGKCCYVVERPSQSWCYVEVLQE